MLTRSVLWMGNRVHLQEIEGTDLTLVQWCRPWNGVLRGVRVLDCDELHQAMVAVEEAAAGRRPHPRLEDVAGRPLNLERYLADVLPADAEAG